MRIVFMGGKRIGCGCLNVLYRDGHEVAAVFVNPGDTAPDRWYPSVCERAIRRQTPVFEFADVNGPEALACIRKLAPEMIVVVYYDQILKKDLIRLPPRGCVNLHMALAEEYRGCYPTTWVLLNGERRTGVTLHCIDESIDGGAILAQREVSVASADTGRTLYEKCTDAAIALFSDTFDAVARGDIRPRAQEGGKARYYRREFPNRRIDFDRSGREIYDHIRAMLFEPFPAPYFVIGKDRYEIRRVTQSPETGHQPFSV